MRLLLTSVAAVLFLLLAGCLNPTPEANTVAMPDAATIENLVRQKFAEGRAGYPSQAGDEKPVLLAFEIALLDQLSPSHWYAKVGLSVDFGPPPPSVIGFKQKRRVIYQLLLKQQGERWELLRFSPAGHLQFLPA